LEIFDRVERDQAIRVLVLTGTGRAFSAGYDLADVEARAARDHDPDPGAPSAGSAFEQVANRLEDLPMPTICRLNGGVYGGSTDLALACDFRIGVDTCELMMPAARLGLHYYNGGMVRYVSRLGLAAAKMLFLTARRIDAAEMLRIGYLDEAVPAEALDARVDALAAALVDGAPVAIRGMKRTLNEIARGKLDEAAADARHRASMRGDEVREGVAAYKGKRSPRFGGPSPSLEKQGSDRRRR
jgi:enoyl-CoA hydratase